MCDHSSENYQRHNQACHCTSYFVQYIEGSDTMTNSSSGVRKCQTGQAMEMRSALPSANIYSTVDGALVLHFVGVAEDAI